MSGRDLERGAGKGPAAGGYHNGGYNQTAYYPNNRRDSDSQWTSWLVPVIVVANVAMFIVTMYVNNCPRNNLGFEGGCVAKFLGRLSFQPLKENPLFGPSSNTFRRLRVHIQLEIKRILALHSLLDKKPLPVQRCVLQLQKMGALQWDNVVHGNQGWRLITCMWLHAGVIHLLANMLSLVFIGIRLEQQFGFVRVGAIYLISGFGGSILSSLFIQNNNISVGASGALFGLLGAMLSELITNWTIYTNKAAALFTLIFIIAINLALGMLPHVDNFAHIGGFLTGFLLGFILLIRPQFGWVERPYRPADARVKSKHMGYQYVLWLVALVLLIAGFVVALIMLFRGENGNDHCSWCHYLSCVPTSRWKCDN